MHQKCLEWKNYSLRGSYSSVVHQNNKDNQNGENGWPDIKVGEVIEIGVDGVFHVLCDIFRGGMQAWHKIVNKGDSQVSCQKTHDHYNTGVQVRHCLHQVDTDYQNNNQSNRIVQCKFQIAGVHLLFFYYNHLLFFTHLNLHKIMALCCGEGTLCALLLNLFFTECKLGT